MERLAHGPASRVQNFGIDQLTCQHARRILTIHRPATCGDRAPIDIASLRSSSTEESQWSMSSFWIVEPCKSISEDQILTTLGPISLRPTQAKSRNDWQRRR